VVQKCCAIEESNLILCDGQLRNSRGTVSNTIVNRVILAILPEQMWHAGHSI